MEIKPMYVSIPFEEWEEYQKMKIENKETVKPFELEVGKDYVAKQNEESIVIDRKGDFDNVGFFNGMFLNFLPCLDPEAWHEATEEEVIEAFEKQCARRLGENWRDAKLKTHANGEKIALNTGNHEPFIRKSKRIGWTVCNKNGVVYGEGKWAESWEEPKFAEKLKDINRPWYLCTYGQIRKVFEKEDQDKNHLPTEELTEGLLALIQLLSFRHDVWEKEGKPEGLCWCITTTIKGGLEVAKATHEAFTFSFKKKETAEWFLETHKDLLTEYFNKIIKQ